jgi:hypothetical protein
MSKFFVFPEFSWIGATSTATDAPEIVSAALDLESKGK